MLETRSLGELRTPYARMEWNRLARESLKASIDAVMTRIEPLMHSDVLRLTDPEYAVDVSELFDGRTLLCNLSHGLLGEAENRTLSALLVSELWNAAIRRGKAYPPLFLVIDEFTVIQSPTFASILNQARKFGLHLIFLQQEIGRAHV